MGKRLIIITSFYPGKDRGKGPWSERFGGLYEPIFKRSSYDGFESHWYDVSNAKLYSVQSGSFLAQQLNLRSFIASHLKPRGSDQGCILVAYPFCRGRDILKSHSLISAFQKCTDTIVLDFVDPPVMMIDLFVGRSLTGKLISAILKRRERTCLNLATTVVTNSAEMGAYLQDAYGLGGTGFVDVPMAVRLSDFVLSDDRWEMDEFTIVYGGVISKERGIADLLACVERISNKWPVRLLLCGKVNPEVRIPLRRWVEVHSSLSYSEYVALLTGRAHVGIVPYPVNKWWNMVSISKVATYAAAGIPIMTLDLLHTSRFITRWDCGEIAHSWDEMELCLNKINLDRDLCRKLGKNARTAAEQALSWERVTKKFEMGIFEHNSSA